MKLQVRHAAPSNGGATRIIATGQYGQYDDSPLNEATPDRPLAAVQELAEWCERWGMPAAAERLRADLVAHVEALDAHEEHLIEALARTRGRRKRMVDAGASS